MKTIYEFTKGEEIVRIQPAKPYPGGTRDRAYIGQKFTYIGIANGMIYVKTDEKDFLFSKALKELALDLWDEGWDNYIDPTSLEDDTHVGTIDAYYLHKAIDVAVEKEDYKLAAKLEKIKNQN